MTAFKFVTVPQLCNNTSASRPWRNLARVDGWGEGRKGFTVQISQPSDFTISNCVDNIQIARPADFVISRTPDMPLVKTRAAAVFEALVI
jgi:hypothetical protein